MFPTENLVFSSLSIITYDKSTGVGVYKRPYSCAYNPLKLGAYNPVIQFLSENKCAYNPFSKLFSNTGCVSKKGVPTVGGKSKLGDVPVG